MTASDATPAPGGASLPKNKLPLPWGSLDREPNKSIIIKMLAEGGTNAGVARELGYATETVRDFRKRHIERITALGEGAADRMAGMWATEKHNRVATYEQQAADAQLAIDELWAQAKQFKVPVDDERLIRLQKSQARALRSIAEELGGLPARIQVRMGGDVGKLILEGVDVSEI